MTWTHHCLFQELCSHFFLFLEWFFLCFPLTCTWTNHRNKHMSKSPSEHKELGVASFFIPWALQGHLEPGMGNIPCPNTDFQRNSAQGLSAPAQGALRVCCWQQQMLSTSARCCAKTFPSPWVPKEIYLCVFIFKNQLFRPDFPVLWKAFELKIGTLLV